MTSKPQHNSIRAAGGLKPYLNRRKIAGVCAYGYEDLDRWLTGEPKPTVLWLKSKFGVSTNTMRKYLAIYKQEQTSENT